MKCGDCGREGAIDGICQDCWDARFDEDERRARYDDGDIYDA